MATIFSWNAFLAISLAACRTCSGTAAFSSSDTYKWDVTECYVTRTSPERSRFAKPVSHKRTEPPASTDTSPCPLVPARSKGVSVDPYRKDTKGVMNPLYQWFLTRVYKPKAAKKSFPRNGNPGRLARNIILKSLCSGMILGSERLARGSFERTILRPSDRIISPDSTSTLSKEYKDILRAILKSCRVDNELAKDFTVGSSDDLNFPMPNLTTKRKLLPVWVVIAIQQREENSLPRKLRYSFTRPHVRGPLEITHRRKS
ncbi:hypothetical protein J437_LFUL005100 [Ladona fulva]|uniref:Secreted protein n=1 Tax=Ladona fulva TaxID=123851 RepID=A0A8K0JY78_LADFU|nr:hypothetical protein J437_LFUL005100 [Ladona fulva]